MPWPPAGAWSTRGSACSTKAATRRCRASRRCRSWSGRAIRSARSARSWRRWRQSNTTVLLRGESGTGKGLIAHAIHLNSPRAKKPFVTVSCAALPLDLIESELFGYEKGAFTGADALKKGRLELANGGTLFLDEVGELPPAVQVKLLRVLQEREFERLGGTQHHSARRARAGGHEPQPRQGRSRPGDFREDLYYRLNVFPIFVPPLRERKADVLLLADHFLEKFAREQAKTIARISTPAIDMLMSYHWPGNVRELSNAIERAVVICEGGVLHSHHLPPTLQTAESSGTAIQPVAQGDGGGGGEGCVAGRTEERARQPRDGGPPAADHPAHLELQAQELRHRRPAIPGVTVRRRCLSNRREPCAAYAAASGGAGPASGRPARRCRRSPAGRAGCAPIRRAPGRARRPAPGAARRRTPRQSDPRPPAWSGSVAAPALTLSTAVAMLP